MFLSVSAQITTDRNAALVQLQVQLQVPPASAALRFVLKGGMRESGGFAFLFDPIPRFQTAKI